MNSEKRNTCRHDQRGSRSNPLSEEIEFYDGCFCYERLQEGLYSPFLLETWLKLRVCVCVCTCVCESITDMRECLCSTVSSTYNNTGTRSWDDWLLVVEVVEVRLYALHFAATASFKPPPFRFLPDRPMEHDG